jgi:hypothetical protein
MGFFSKKAEAPVAAPPPPPEPDASKVAQRSQILRTFIHTPVTRFQKYHQLQDTMGSSH